MLVKLENPAQFTQVIGIISELVTEVRIKLNEFGMSITAIDPANVAMIGFRLPRSAFSQFEVGDETIGVNLDDLKKILKRAGSRSSLILEKRENALDIRIEDRILRKFSLNLIEVEGEEIDFENKVSRMEFVSEIEMNSEDFIDSIEDCSVVADACSFIVEDGKFIIEARALNSARSEFSGDEVRIKAENCKARYSLEYLSKFAKGSKISDKTTLRFADEHPLGMHLKIDAIELSFILAPRVETDD
jgi:proliferating cell nuclear antigen